MRSIILSPHYTRKLYDRLCCQGFAKLELIAGCAALGESIRNCGTNTSTVDTSP